MIISGIKGASGIKSIKAARENFCAIFLTQTTITNK